MSEQEQIQTPDSEQPLEGSQTESQPTSPEVVAQPRDDKGKFRPKGLPDDEEWDHVELSPDAQKRFNRVYGALKHHQLLGEQLLKDNVALADRLQALEKNVFDSDHQRTEAQLKAAKVGALSSGDYQRVADIDDALMELRIKAQQPTQPVLASETQQAQDLVLDADTKALLDEWGSERGPSGEPLRPWVDPKHPLHEKATRAHAMVMADPMTAFADVSTVLEAIDKHMGVAPHRTVQPSAAAKPARHLDFKASEAPPKSRAPLPTLTAQQIHIAKRMYRGDPDPVGRYKRAMQSHG